MLTKYQRTLLKGLIRFFKAHECTLVRREPLWDELRKYKGFDTGKMASALRWLDEGENLITIQYASGAPMGVYSIALSADGEHYFAQNRLRRREKFWPVARDVIATVIAVAALVIALLSYLSDRAG